LGVFPDNILGLILLWSNVQVYSGFEYGSLNQFVYSERDLTGLSMENGYLDPMLVFMYGELVRARFIQDF